MKLNISSDKKPTKEQSLISVIEKISPVFKELNFFVKNIEKKKVLIE